MIVLGERLCKACQTAEKEVFLAAPFIKRNALHRVIEAIPNTIQLTVIVRFLPLDLASNVTDKEIVEDLLSRPNTEILAHPTIHAKIYRIDNRVLIGSANLTGRALGWGTPSNVELLLEVPAVNEDVRTVESHLRKTGYNLTPSIVNEIVSVLPKNGPIYIEDLDTSYNYWVPICSRPNPGWPPKMSHLWPLQNVPPMIALRCRF